MNFCTYFDFNYIHKGIAMYLSLERITTDFHMYVMAFDRRCYEKLKELEFEHMTVELWDDWETPEIKTVKEDRNRAEYCWTCGPSVIYHFLTYYNLLDITYLDSDLFFIGKPQIAFDEIGDASVAITEQGISEASAKMYGRYCVQFVFFRNNSNGINALTWWRDACVDWCYQRFEEGRFGDQKYLDQFPVKFEGVYVIKNPGVGIAPWNMYRYKYKDNGRTVIWHNKEYQTVFFHMHGLKGIISDNTMILQSSDAIINKNMKFFFFNEYAILLKAAFNDYLNQRIDNVIIKGIPSWRRIELKLRSKLNKIEELRNIYYKSFGEKEHGSGTKL